MSADFWYGVITACVVILIAKGFSLGKEVVEEEEKKRA